MKKDFTLNDFYELFIKDHTQYGIKKAFNQMFYGNPNLDYVSQSLASKIRTSGISSRHALYHDYVEKDLKIEQRAAYIQSLNLTGLPERGSELLGVLSQFELPQELIDSLSKENDLYVCLAEILYYCVIRKNVTSVSIITENTSPNLAPRNGKSFFYDYLLKSTDNDLCVDMAFHAGNSFLLNQEKVELLSEICVKAKRVRILINSGDYIVPMLDHLKQPGLFYPPFDNLFNTWKERSSMENHPFSVRTTHLPLMHRIYAVYSNTDTNFGAVNVAFYAYGGYRPKHEIRHEYLRNSQNYTVIRHEFDYLWENCSNDYD